MSELQKIVIGICDDQYSVLEQLRNIISSYLFEKEQDADVILFQNGNEVISSLKKLDILFLDIEMPGIDGIEVGEFLFWQNSQCKIIMATGRLERFKEAFKIDAYRFVSKPFAKKEVENALTDALKATIGLDTIELYENRILYHIPQREICYFNAYDSYIEALTRNQKLRKDTSLGKIEETLDNHIFYRLSRTYLVNLFFVKDYKDGIVLIEECELKMPRLKKKEFEKKLKEFDLKYR